MQLSPPPSLDLDDAFADGEDDEADYKFSTDAIRQDIARHELSWADTEASVDSERGRSFELDESVSTLDMNGTGPHSPSSSPPLDSALDEDEMAGQFSQISLSESGPDEPSDDLAIPNGEESTVSTPHPYPNVIIDVSKSPTHRVTMSWNSKREGRSSRTSDESPGRASIQSSHSEAAASPPPNNSVSLPDAASSSQSIPPSSTPPVPVPLPSKNPTHRPTRSSGPSALEKVMSRTRPSFLPPKSRQEDNKHLDEWESMMKQSRATGEYLFSKLC